MDYELLGKVNFSWDTTNKLQHHFEGINTEILHEEDVLSYAVLDVFIKLLGQFYISNTLEVCKSVMDCLENKKKLYCQINPALKSVSIHICKSTKIFARFMPEGKLSFMKRDLIENCRTQFILNAINYIKDNVQSESIQNKIICNTHLIISHFLNAIEDDEINNEIRERKGKDSNILFGDMMYMSGEFYELMWSKNYRIENINLANKFANEIRDKIQKHYSDNLFRPKL